MTVPAGDNDNIALCFRKMYEPGSPARKFFIDPNLTKEKRDQQKKCKYVKMKTKKTNKNGNFTDKLVTQNRNVGQAFALQGYPDKPRVQN